MARLDRAAQNVGNIVLLEHVNVTQPDQGLATLYYVVALGGTRDPYIMVGVDNMWVNYGRTQVHLPTRYVLPPTGVGSADDPMRAVLVAARAIEAADPEIININVMAGYSYADVPDCGFSLSASTRGDPDRAMPVVATEAQWELWDAVAALPERERTAVALRYLGDLTEAQVAQTMGVAPGTVAATLHAARTHLAASLGADDEAGDGTPPPGGSPSPAAAKRTDDATGGPR